MPRKLHNTWNHIYHILIYHTAFVAYTSNTFTRLFNDAYYMQAVMIYRKYHCKLQLAFLDLSKHYTQIILSVYRFIVSI